MYQIRFKDRPTWLTGKGQYITSSESATLIGLNPYEKREDLLKLKLGQIKKPSLDRSAAVQAGIELEDAVAWRWNLERDPGERAFIPLVDPGPYTVQVAGKSNNPQPLLACTIDRALLYANSTGMWSTNPGEAMREVLELKVSTEDKFYDGIPPYYAAQVQHQMLVCGVDLARLVVLLVSKHKRSKWFDLSTSERIRLMTDGALREYSFTRDQDMQHHIFEAAKEARRELRRRGWGQKELGPYSENEEQQVEAVAEDLGLAA